MFERQKEAARNSLVGMLVHISLPLSQYWTIVNLAWRASRQTSDFVEYAESTPTLFISDQNVATSK
jgi:hypothetical protein